MKTRIISALVALVILFVALLGFKTPFFDLIVSAISVIAVYELAYNTGIVKDKFLLTCALVVTAIIPLSGLYLNFNIRVLIIYVYIVVLFLRFLKVYENIKFQNLACLISLSILVPAVLSIFIILREKYEYEGIFYALLCLGGGWISDSGAYFAGTFFGKNKLAPKISPKKTVEGYIGGLISSVIGYFIIGFVMSKLILFQNPQIDTVQVNYLVLAIMAPICSSAGVLGDLFASVIKRQSGIKDYGNIMPGHGGVMDRFDSVLFVTPTVFFILQFIEVVQITMG